MTRIIGKCKICGKIRNLVVTDMLGPDVGQYSDGRSKDLIFTCEEHRHGEIRIDKKNGILVQGDIVAFRRLDRE